MPEVDGYDRDAKLLTGRVLARGEQLFFWRQYKSSPNDISSTLSTLLSPTY